MRRGSRSRRCYPRGGGPAGAGATTAPSWTVSCGRLRIGHPRSFSATPRRQVRDGLLFAPVVLRLLVRAYPGDAGSVYLFDAQGVAVEHDLLFTVVFGYRRVSLFLILSTALFALSMKPFSLAFRTVDSST